MFGHRSLLLSYNTVLTTLGVGDGTVALQQPISFPVHSQSPRYLQLVQANFSKYIANVLNISTPFAYNNTTIRWTMNGGTTWTKIIMPFGAYSLASIQAAITTATYLLWTNASDPGFVIQSNTATGKTYVIIDNSKLYDPPTVLGLDFGTSACSDIAEFLGFNPAAATFIGNNVYSAPNPAHINLIGDSVSVRITGFGMLSNKSGASSYEIANVPLVGSSTANEIVYPQFPFLLPMIMLQQCPQTVSNYTITLAGSRMRNGVPWPLYFIEGQVNIAFQLIF